MFNATRLVQVVDPDNGPVVDARPLVSAIGSGIVAADDWPQWRGVHRDGHVPALPRTLASPSLLWKRPACTTDASTCAAGIAVSAGVVLTADHDDKNDYYRCLDAEKGTDIWTRTFPNEREMEYGPGPRATPLIYEGKVYVLSAFGELYAFDLKTGKTIWQKDFIKDFGALKAPKWGYCGSPLVAGGKLIVNPGGKTSIAALDPATGKCSGRAAARARTTPASSWCAFGGVEQVVGNYDASLGRLGPEDRQTPVARSPWRSSRTPATSCPRRSRSAASCWWPIKRTVRTVRLRQGGRDRREAGGQERERRSRGGHAGRRRRSGSRLVEEARLLGRRRRADTLWTSKVRPFPVDCHLIVSQDLGLAFSKGARTALFRSTAGVRVLLGQAKICEQTLMHPILAGGRLYVRDSEFFYCYDLSGRQ